MAAADDKSKSKPGAPSFYSAAASMKSPGAGGAGDGKSNAPGTEAGASGEKVKNIKVLLEVFNKMDQLEDDQAKKDMIRQMSDMAKQYQQALEGGGAGDGKPVAKSASSDGGPGAGAPGGGGGAGAPGAESMAVPA